jgi:hypothetical protein
MVEVKRGPVSGGVFPRSPVDPGIVGDAFDQRPVEITASSIGDSHDCRNSPACRLAFPRATSYLAAMHEPAIGVIGGSGLYHLDGLTANTLHAVETPWGLPSDVIHGGRLAGRQVYFLPRGIAFCRMS